VKYAVLLIMFTSLCHADSDLEDRIEELEQETAFNQVMILTAPRPEKTPTRDWSSAYTDETPCQPNYIHVTEDGDIERRCGIDPAKLRRAASKAMNLGESENALRATGGADE